jgi:hypothetical protein
MKVEANANEGRLRKLPKTSQSCCLCSSVRESVYARHRGYRGPLSKVHNAVTT